MPVCIDSMYVFSKEFLFCLQLERLFFFHIMLLSPLPALPANTSHGSSALSLPLDCSTLLLSSLACSLSSFASCFFFSGIFQFQTLAPLHPHLSFISPLYSLLALATSRHCGHSWNKSFSASPAVPEEKQACGGLFQGKKSELRSIFSSS